MGKSEEGKSSSKSEKSSSPVPSDQTDIHVHPDWAAMQAYYGPRLAFPPYYNSSVASGHAPHPYMWGPPQPMMSAYGAPYAALYSPGGVYAHSTVPLGSHSHGHGVPVFPAEQVGSYCSVVMQVVPPLSIETHEKSMGNMDGGLIKKLRGYDGLAMSIGNGNTESAVDKTESGVSQSANTEGCSDGSDQSSTGVVQTRKKRSHKGTPKIATASGNGKTEEQASSVHAREVNAVSNKVLGATVAPTSVTGKLFAHVRSPAMATTSEHSNPPNMNAKTSPSSVPQTCAALPSEAWLPNERELKRERRKQSNRESARRSRLRKQVETEELAKQVESLTDENMALKSEINGLTKNSEKVRLENATLMERLRNAGKTEEIVLNNIDNERAPPVSTENLLSRVNNSGSLDRIPEEDDGMYENTNSGTKLRQLLDTSPRADSAVVPG